MVNKPTNEVYIPSYSSKYNWRDNRMYKTLIPGTERFISPLPSEREQRLKQRQIDMKEIFQAEMMSHILLSLARTHETTYKCHIHFNEMQFNCKNNNKGVLLKKTKNIKELLKNNGNRLF